MPVNDKENEKREQIYKVNQEGRMLFKKILTISHNIPYNQYLMPKYMHIRFDISMFVLTESSFKSEEVVERRASTYCYLKPYYISDNEIRKVIDFGDTKVPAYMPITVFRNWK